MHETKHISDIDLKRIVDEQSTSVSEITIETHVANCAVCQERMLALASDEEWRRTLARNYSDPDLLVGSASLASETGQLDSAYRKGDEFDLNSVDLMLKQVLAPPTHPEMLGRIGRYDVESIIGCGGMGAVSYTHLRAHRDRTRSRMPSSA